MIRILKTEFNPSESKLIESLTGLNAHASIVDAGALDRFISGLALEEMAQMRSGLGLGQIDAIEYLMFLLAVEDGRMLAVFRLDCGTGLIALPLREDLPWQDLPDHPEIQSIEGEISSDSPSWITLAIRLAGHQPLTISHDLDFEEGDLINLPASLGIGHTPFRPIERRRYGWGPCHMGDNS